MKAQHLQPRIEANNILYVVYGVVELRLFSRSRMRA